MQAAELAILNWIQAYLRCGLLDTMLPWVTHLCDHGEIWILLAAMLLAFPKTRGLRGLCAGAGLAAVQHLAQAHDRPDTALCGQSGGVAADCTAYRCLVPLRAYGGVLCRHAGTEPGGKQPLEARAGAGASHRLLPVVPLRSLAHRCTGRCRSRRAGRLAGSKAGTIFV